MLIIDYFSGRVEQLVHPVCVRLYMWPHEKFERNKLRLTTVPKNDPDIFSCNLNKLCLILIFLHVHY